MSNETANSSLKMQKLYEAFAKSLPVRLDAIKTLWKKCKQLDFANTTIPDSLCNSLHTLAISADTFEKTRIAELVHTLERNFHHILASSKKPDKELIAKIDEDLILLQSLIDSLQLDSITPTNNTSKIHDADKHNDIVLLQDDAEQAKICSEQLDLYGYRIHICSNFNELENILSCVIPVVLLVDMESQGVLSILVKLSGLQELPVIFFSVNDDWETRLTAVRFGAIAFFKKPLDCCILANQLNGLIETDKYDKKRILIIEDQVEIAEHYIKVLSDAGMIVEWLKHPANVIATIGELSPDIILMDFYMPTCTGLELAGIIRQIDAYKDIPMVFLSDKPINEKHRATLYPGGGDDFLRKPISNEDLIYAVSHRAERFQYFNSRALHDRLTGLLNHAALINQLESMQAQALRNLSTLSFVKIDIDSFDFINNKYGFSKGNIVIASLAHLLKKRLRISDVIGRYAGKEFGIILPDTESGQAYQIIEELRTRFEKITHHHNNETFHATFSAGIATTPPCMLMQDLINNANEALNASKQQGHNQVQVF